MSSDIFNVNKGETTWGHSLGGGAVVEFCSILLIVIYGPVITGIFFGDVVWGKLTFILL